MALQQFRCGLQGNAGPDGAPPPLLLNEAQLADEQWALPIILFSQAGACGHERRAQMHGLLRGYLSKLGQLIRMGQEEGAIRSDIGSEGLALFWLGLVHPASILGHFGFADLNLVEHAQNAWQIFYDAVRNEQRSRGGF